MPSQGVVELTPHDDVNAILTVLTGRLCEILGDRLAGLYLTGSLTYGDFDRGSSDIDYLAVLERSLSPHERASLQELHLRIGERYPEWAARIEGSYITRDMLECVEPPEAPRPYVNGGAFWDPDPRYGNEWLVNLYAVRECGVALAGPEPNELIDPVRIEDVREASRRDLFGEWVPKLGDPAFFESSHHQAYATLTLCRILHRAENPDVVSKRIAADWVKRTCNKPWVVELIDRAERWQHGQKLDEADRVCALIVLARDQVRD